jgi:hypothetical protein
VVLVCFFQQYIKAKMDEMDTYAMFSYVVTSLAVLFVVYIVYAVASDDSGGDDEDDKPFERGSMIGGPTEGGTKDD